MITTIHREYMIVGWDYDNRRTGFTRRRRPSKSPSDIQDIRKMLLREDQEINDWVAKSLPKVNLFKILNSFSKKSEESRNDLLELVIQSKSLINGIMEVNRVLHQELSLGGLSIDVAYAESVITKLFLLKYAVIVLNTIKFPKSQRDSIMESLVTSVIGRAATKENKDNTKDLIDAISKISLPPDKPRY
jgi:hypothetical protein